MLFLTIYIVLLLVWIFVIIPVHQSTNDCHTVCMLSVSLSYTFKYWFHPIGWTENKSIHFSPLVILTEPYIGDCMLCIIVC